MKLGKKKSKKIVYEDFDMSTKESRENQVLSDFGKADADKSQIKVKWDEFKDYYDGECYSKAELIDYAQKFGSDFIPPVLPDARIQVESQIEVVVPTFEFKGREASDDDKAEEREDLVNYILYRNEIDVLNYENERPRLTFGDSFIKASFDGNAITQDGTQGEIVLGNPHPFNIFPDPSAYKIDDCEFFIYAFPMSIRKAKRIYPEAEWDRITPTGNAIQTENYSEDISLDDTLQIMEYWYKDEEGDIACSILIEGVEVKWIEKYWLTTKDSGNKSYPFIKFPNVFKSKSFWDDSEIAPIMDLIDAGNRELMTSLLNSMYMGNDIIMADKGAFADGDEPTNEPGSIWNIQPGKTVRRLGGVTNNSNAIATISFIHEKIQETNGNFATKGQEPERVTTASGYALLREDRKERATMKNRPRIEAFKRLAKLIDWSALEFYDDERVITIRGDTDEDEPKEVKYKSSNYKKGEYFPPVDIIVNSGEGIAHSKVMTLTILENLLKVQITPQNAPFVKIYLDLLDVPNTEKLKKEIDTMIGYSAPDDSKVDEIFNTMSDAEKQRFAGLSEDQQNVTMQKMMEGK